MLCNFIIIGAQKSASTLMHLQLADHPDVFMPMKEIPVFEDPYYSQGAVDRLQTLFAMAPEGKVRGMKRPDYLPKPECAERIQAHIPGVKLLVTLRDPIERAVSAYFHYMHEGWIPVAPVDVGLTSLLDGEYDVLYPRAQEVVEFGFYGRHLDAYRTAFDSAQMLVVLHDDLIRNGREVMEGVESFLGLKSHFNEHIHASRPKPGTYSMLRLRYLQAIKGITHEFDASRRYSRRRAGVASRLAQSVDTHVLSRIAHSAPPIISADVSHRLRMLYEDDVRWLAEDYNLEVGQWLELGAEGRRL